VFFGTGLCRYFNCVIIRFYADSRIDRVSKGDIMRLYTLIIFVICSSGNIALAQTTYCTTLIEHNEVEADNPWLTVNDSVMGGLSSGGSTLNDGVLTFAGITNTNGGGFSSVRRHVTPGIMAGATKLKVYMNRDMREYSITMRTNVTVSGRRIAFRGPVVGSPVGEWGYGTLFFDSLKGSFRGRAIPNAVFDPAEVVELGLIIYDGKDGPFEMQVKRIEVCE
jgi:hypothetical protein